MIGASPHTGWLPHEVARDAQGFLITGTDLAARNRRPLERSPYLLETSMPGVFAAGDVRHGASRRVASAVGEGAVAIQLLHRLFATDKRTPAAELKSRYPTSRRSCPKLVVRAQSSSRAQPSRASISCSCLCSTPPGRGWCRIWPV